ncbi:MAG TPA: hypothetical protein VGC66_06695 [Pyrinomonadaceae bacterium]|jgi:hypothetical protein
MKKLLVASIILMLLILSPTARAQTLPSQPSKEEEEKARAELERKVLILLEEVVSDSQLLKLAENRAIVQASAADLLWARDEKRARAFFRDALTGIGDAFAGTDRKDSSQMYAYMMLVQLRHQLLRMVARRDAQLALDLLASTRPPAADDASKNFGIPDQELALEQSLAVEAAANDPKRALQMAEESLSKGISYSLLSVLRRLQQKDSELAQRFLADIIKKLQTENFSRSPMAAFVAQDLLRTALRPQEAIAFGKSQGAVPVKPLSFDDQTKRDLADVVTRAALGGQNDFPAILSIQYLLPDLEKLVPERSEQLRKRVSDAQKALDPQARKWMELEPLMRDGTTDAILEAAGKAPAGIRNALYSSAAWKLFEAGDAERARQIISDNLSGQERDQALAQIDRRLVMRALEQGKLDEAKKLIARVQSKQGRATQLSLLAMALMKKGERKMALELMEETRKLVNPQPDNQEEINILLVVARAYASIDAARAFELIEPVVDQANDMISAAALLDKFSAGGQGGMFRKGEMVLQPGFMTASTMFTQYGRELGALARADFTRTKQVADRFQRNEVRLMARLMIAQSVLSDRLGAGEEDDSGLGFSLSFGGNVGMINTFEY